VRSFSIKLLLMTAINSSCSTLACAPSELLRRGAGGDKGLRKQGAEMGNTLNPVARNCRTGTFGGTPCKSALRHTQ
jgi:hypothetical protein